MAGKPGRRGRGPVRGGGDAVTFKLAGFRPWLVQRVTATYMLVLALVVPVFFWLDPRHSYADWKAWVANPVISLAIFTFFAALLSHMWVGLRDVLLDYARPAGLCRFLLGMLGAGLLGVAMWVCWILVRLHT